MRRTFGMRIPPLVIEPRPLPGLNSLIGVRSQMGWGEPRATRIGPWVKINIKASTSCEELERGMLIPSEIILDSIVEDGQISRSMPSTCTEAQSRFVSVREGER